MSAGFSKRQWEQIKERDQVCVWHGPSCDLDMLIPQHRSGRGMGGSKSKNRLSNGVAMCSLVNGEIEANAELATEARHRGIKISLHANPEIVPVTYWDGRTFYLNDDGSMWEVRDE